MVTVHQTILALVILQIYVSAAPSDTPKLEDKTKTENEEPKSETQPSPLEDSKDDSISENQRQKRFYNHYGYGFPPISPVQYPTYNKRDQASDLGVYGIDDPLSHIHRRLQEIASVIRQPPPPPTPTHFPLFFPVIFVPQFGCACNPTTDNIPQATAKPDTPRPTAKPPVDGNSTSPDVVNRWPEMDDERQNWGLVVNETEEDYDNGDDFSRPISFDPIVLNTSMSRPAPPVEHGSNQAGSQDGRQSTTTVRPRPPNNDISRPPSNNSPSLPEPGVASSVPASGPYPQNPAETPREAPTTCDSAVLSCCHQLQVTYDCFSILGCPDPTSYGNPCDPLVILKVIGKYQKFYGVRTG